MQISKHIQLNNQRNGQNVYKSINNILRQKCTINILVPYDTLQCCSLPPYFIIAPHVNNTDTFNKTVPRHLYPSLKPHTQTNAQTCYYTYC